MAVRLSHALDAGEIPQPQPFQSDTTDSDISPSSRPTSFFGAGATHRRRLLLLFWRQWLSLKKVEPHSLARVRPSVCAAGPFERTSPLFLRVSFVACLLFALSLPYGPFSGTNDGGPWPL